MPLPKLPPSQPPLLTIYIHTGHQQTVKRFLASMECSGYRLASCTQNFIMPSRTLRFHRPDSAS